MYADDLIDRIDAATNAIGRKLHSLITDAEGGTHILAERIAPIVAELYQLCSNHEDPIPAGTDQPPAA